jgi:hypothetical protein
VSGSFTPQPLYSQGIAPDARGWVVQIIIIIIIIIK